MIEYLIKNTQLGYIVLAEVEEEIAEGGKKVVGTVAVNFEWSDWRNRVFYWLQSFYVYPEWR